MIIKGEIYQAKQYGTQRLHIIRTWHPNSKDGWIYFRIGRMKDKLRVWWFKEYANKIYI